MNAPVPIRVPLAPAPSSSWTFTQGFLVGQACFIILCLLFVRYVVFSAAEADDDEAWRHHRAERAKKSLLSTTAVPPPPTRHLLDKTGYEMGTHPAESTGWLNVLLAQMLQGYRNDLLSSSGEEGARKHFERWLNPPGRTLSWLDPIEVTALNLGKSFPLLSNARIRPADGQGRVRAEIDLDWMDTVSLSISTKVLINFPRPRFAVLPVSIGVELVSMGGTLSVQVHAPEDQRQHIHLCLLPDFHLNLKTTSLLGSRAKLQANLVNFPLTADIPKIEQLLVARLRSAIQDRYVYPRHLTFALPRLISHTAPMTADAVIPDSQDIRNVAVSAMQQGIRDLGHDLAALAPVDSASALDSQEDDGIDEPDTDAAEEEHMQLQPAIPLQPASYVPSRAPTTGTGGSIASIPRRGIALATDPAIAAQFRYRGQFSRPSSAAGRERERMGTVNSRA